MFGTNTLRGRRPAALSALTICLAAGLVGPAAAQQMQMPPRGAPADNPADKAFIAAMHDMMAGMDRAMPTGNTDRDFVAMMLPHHQAAVDMAKAELQYGHDPDLKGLAQAIVTDQDREIALMKAWEDRHPK